MPDLVDNLHAVSERSTLWSRVNAAEAMPGVHTPLSWQFWDGSADRAVRALYRYMGLLSRGELAQPAHIDDRCLAVFHGQATLNVDFFRMIADRTPGTSSDDFERDFLGSVGARSSGRSDRRYYVSAKLRSPIVRRRIGALIHADHRYVEHWWRSNVTKPPCGESAVASALYQEARTRFEKVMKAHGVASIIAQYRYAILTRMVVEAGMPGLETELSGGYTDVEDVRVTTAMWEASRGRLSLGQFLSSHGYHGSAEGQLASTVWREDPHQLDQLLDTYASMPDDAAPAIVAAERAERRRAAEARLLATVPRRRRDAVHRVLDGLGDAVRLRERGKATFLRALDVGRLAARAAGQDLARRGVLDDPDDVFFLLREEGLGGPHPNAASVVAWRRARYDEHCQVELPASWSGNPKPVSSDAGQLSTQAVHGLGVSPGVVEATARLIADPTDAEGVTPGDVVVCHTTDPSWVALMLVSGGLVIDLGGPMSHGAIIARELGVPCVVNTKTGTRQLHNGDRVRVDGTTGAVEVIALSSRT